MVTSNGRKYGWYRKSFSSNISVYCAHGVQLHIFTYLRRSMHSQCCRSFWFPSTLRNVNLCRRKTMFDGIQLFARLLTRAEIFKMDELTFSIIEFLIIKRRKHTFLLSLRVVLVQKCKRKVRVLSMYNITLVPEVHTMWTGAHPGFSQGEGPNRNLL